MPREIARTRTKKTNRALREQSARYKAASLRPEFKLVTRKQINAVTRKIVAEFNPEKVILFGSYAYGKPSIDSDVDVLIVMESNERPTLRAARVYKAVQGKTFPMDILVRTPQELQHRLKMDDFFIKEIVERGKVVYAR